MKYIAHILNKNLGDDVNDDKIQKIIKCNTIDECLNCLMTNIYNENGNGDNENGGYGSLWKLAPVIYDTLKNMEHYSYDYMEYWITSFDENKNRNINCYTFKLSSVVEQVVSIVADNHSNALKKLNETKNLLACDLKNVCSRTEYGWDYDGNITDRYCGVEEINVDNN